MALQVKPNFFGFARSGGGGGGGMSGRAFHCIGRGGAFHVIGCDGRLSLHCIAYFGYDGIGGGGGGCGGAFSLGTVPT